MPAGRFAGVEVQGLREVKAKLKAFDARLPKTLNAGMKAAATTVVADAKHRTPVVTGRAQSSIRVQAGSKVFLVGGKKSVPYFGWLDFGTRNPRSGRPRSVGPWANTGTGPRDGRILYKAIKAKTGEIKKAVLGAVSDALRATRL